MGGRGSNSMDRIGGNLKSKSNATIEYFKKQGVDFKNSLPDGWMPIKGALTAPQGYYWASNNASRFGGNRQQALVKEPRTQAQKDQTVAAISQSGASAWAMASAMPKGTDGKLVGLIQQGAKAYTSLPKGYHRATNATNPPKGWFWASSQPNNKGNMVLVKERKK